MYASLDGLGREAAVRVLHVVKTSDGAAWAADQVAVLVRLGVSVHVALPRDEGRMMDRWIESGATLHILDLDLPARRPWLLARRKADARGLVELVRPDIIHSHFVGTTMLMRLALGHCVRCPPRGLQYA